MPQFRFVLDALSRADEQALRGRSLSAMATAGLMLLSRGATPRICSLSYGVASMCFGQVARAGNGVEAFFGVCVPGQRGLREQLGR